MGFNASRKIQEISLPLLIDNPHSEFFNNSYLSKLCLSAYSKENIIPQSQASTGKTAAFSLATMSRIDPKIQSPQALILAPTFELAFQIGSIIECMAQFLPYIKIAYAVRH